jgi:hypothetical protein
MSGFIKSVLGVAVLSTAMLAGMGEKNEAQARPYGGYYGGYYGPRYGAAYAPYRYNAYRPYYGGGYGYYGRPYGYGYGAYRGGFIGVGPVRVRW